MLKPHLYRNPGTNEGIVSIFDDTKVIWTRTIANVPQTPYRQAKLLAFKTIVENGNWELDENANITFIDGKFEFVDQ